MRCNLIKRTLLLCLLLGCSLAQAQRSVRIGFPELVPPWVNANKQPGIAVELLRDALKADNLQLVPVFLPYARRLQAYRHGTLDGLYGIGHNQKSDEQLIGSISRPLHSFDNIAVALARRQLDINNVSELTQWRVMTWEGANNVLPHSYDRLLALANGRYLESAEHLHARNLFNGRVDVILSDRQTFEWQRRQLQAENISSTGQAIRIYAILPPNEATVLMRDGQLRNQLDKQIQLLRSSPRYQTIFDRYHADVQP